MSANRFPGVILVIASVAIGYAATYFATVRVGEVNGYGYNCFVAYPVYQGLPTWANTALAPIHYLDRHYLRHSKWVHTPREVVSND